MIDISLSTDLAASVRDMKKTGMLTYGELPLSPTQTKKATKIYEGTITLSEVTPLGDDNWY
ncbi:MAG: hypothetical protein K0Q90_1952 [Paenibacillaceae bacterium]|jgi:hypothetical protein|nr:hypothetical protein [Paenibacillaceae bacterium]